mmetsp:Transcript_30997/g.71936  ORF Transcript_30997/g.71936 Transcript_30997/m.71936 type:complete len:108 (-) Transcript_30997:852-1175(-)
MAPASAAHGDKQQQTDMTATAIPRMRMTHVIVEFASLRLCTMSCFVVFCARISCHVSEEHPQLPGMDAGPVAPTSLTVARTDGLVAEDWEYEILTQPNLGGPVHVSK